MVVQKKFNTSIEEIIKQDMPCKFFQPSKIAVEFQMFYQYCRELGFDQKPDYGYLHRLLRDLIYIESYNYMICFEWLVKKQEWRE